MSSGYLPGRCGGQALSLLHQGEQLVRMLQVGLGPGLEQARALVNEARRVFDQVSWTGEGGENDWSAAGYEQSQVISASGVSIFLHEGQVDELRLTREADGWSCLGLLFRPNGACLVDLDGESYLIEASGQILNQAAQDQRFEQTSEKLDRVGEATVPVRTRAAGTDWETLSQSVLGQSAGWFAAVGAVAAGMVAGRTRPTQEADQILHLEPLERDWLRLDGHDFVHIVAYLQPPAGTEISDSARRSTLTLECLSGNLVVSDPGEGEFYRYWTVQASQAGEAQLLLSGHWGGGELQRSIPLRVLPPAHLRATPKRPILVKDTQETLEVVVEVEGQIPNEVWSLDPPQLERGDAQALQLRGYQSLSAGRFQLTFTMTELAEEQSCAQSVWQVQARRDDGATTPMLSLSVLAVRTGLVWLEPTPVRIRADGRSWHEFKVSLLRWNHGLEVDQGALAQLRFQGVGQALEAAELEFHFQEFRGRQLGQHAVYKVKSRHPVPGIGIFPGKLVAEGSSLDIALELDEVSLDPNLNSEDEFRLLEEVLDRYLQGSLQRRWRDDLERYADYLGPNDLRERRKAILKAAVVSWQAVGKGYLQAPNFQRRLQQWADTPTWVASVAFAPVLEAGLHWAVHSQGVELDPQAVQQMRASLIRLVEACLQQQAPATSWQSLQSEWGPDQPLCRFLLDRYVQHCDPPLDWWRAGLLTAGELSGSKIHEIFERFLAGKTQPPQPHLDSHGVPRVKL